MPNEHPSTDEAAALRETIEAMRRVLERKFGMKDADLPPDRELASLGFDSLAFIEYCFEVEGELDIHLPDVPRNLRTIGDLARFIQAELLRKRSGAPT